MSLTPLPSAPSIADPTNFESEADAFLGALPTLVTEWNADIVTQNAAEAAALAALNALIAAAGFSGTSTTSNAIGTGSKTFTTQTGKAFVSGTILLITDDAAPTANWMLGQVTAYNSGTGSLTVSVSQVLGSGTKTAWTISLSGPAGPSSSLVKSSAVKIWTGTDDADFVTAKNLADAAAPVASSVTGTVTLDFNAGMNFTLTLTGNITLAVPSNMTDGDSGVITFVQDATGSRTLSLNASIKKPGAAPTLSTAANAIDRIGYFVRSGVLEITAIEKGFA